MRLNPSTYPASGHCTREILLPFTRNKPVRGDACVKDDTVHLGNGLTIFFFELSDGLTGKRFKRHGTINMETTTYQLGYVLGESIRYGPI